MSKNELLTKIKDSIKEKKMKMKMLRKNKRYNWKKYTYVKYRINIIKYK